MKKLLYILLTALLISCDDGELIVEDFQFEDITMESCIDDHADNGSDYVFYKINNTTEESLSLVFSTTESILQTEGSYSISTYDFEYRKYNDAIDSDYFCASIPPSQPVVIDLYESLAGDLIVTTTISSQDDNDGIDPLDEDINGDGDLTNDDSDGDGTPDYLDVDDDGDNVLTINEGVNTTDLSMSRDTDGDNIPDYLDMDDDGDGIPTIQEDLNRDLDPSNDVDGNGDLFYLTQSVDTANPAINEYRTHSMTISTELDITFSNLTLSNGSKEIIYDLYNFGTYTTGEFTITMTPSF